VILSETLEDEDFRKVVSLVAAYGGIEYSMQQSLDYVRRGKERLTLFPDSPGKQALCALADYVVTRCH